MKNRRVRLTMVAVLAVTTLGLLPASTAGAANSTSCPLGALKKASKPVEITMWHWMLRANGDVLQKLVDEFNGSQSAVKVSLVNQVGWEETLAKYKAGLATGDLPDIVQLQETDQQQMIDTGTVVPAGLCAKADNYSFSDFLPRVISYFTVQGRQYAMPFNTSGPVLYYNKKAFSAAGLDPEKPPTNLTELRAAAEKLKANGVATPMGLKTDPIFVEQWTAMGNRLFANHSNGQKARTTKAVFDSSTGRQVFSWMQGMVKDGLAETNSDIGTGSSDNFLGIRSGSHAMTIDSSAALGTVTAILGAGNDPNIEIGVAPMPGPGAGAARGGVFVQGGELFMVNKSAPAKQAAAWQFLKFLDTPENMTTWAIGTGYLPIRKSSADSTAMQDYWAKNPDFKVAYDQLVAGVNNVATSGSVIGPNIEVRQAVRDAENRMFLEGAAPSTALAEAAKSATAAIEDYNSRIGG